MFQCDGKKLSDLSIYANELLLLDKQGLIYQIHLSKLIGGKIDQLDMSRCGGLHIITIWLLELAFVSNICQPLLCNKLWLWKHVYCCVRFYEYFLTSQVTLQDFKV